MNNSTEFKNPFKPGAGHTPPYLAGRIKEKDEFYRLLEQDIILENMVLTGLRGVGKTVLLDTFKPIAIQEDWLWVGTDLSESASINEGNIALRLITDLSVVTSTILIQKNEVSQIGFDANVEEVNLTLNYQTLMSIYDSTPGLVSDKLKALLEIVWKYLSMLKPKGLIFAYDEAQNLADHAAKEQYPLSLLLDVFQSIQKKKIPFMLVLTGLPTLFPKLVESRTFAERMFRVVFLNRLSKDESREAILKPIEDSKCPVKLADETVDIIIGLSDGYPYFIQFICREVYDAFAQRINAGEDASVPVEEIIRKLDTDFFAGRWSRATDRQRTLLYVIAMLSNCDHEFAVQEIVDKSKEILEKPFSSSHVNQMLLSLSKVGLVYKNRYGKYSFAVPLLGQFIERQDLNDI
ncbi:MAG: ATP-binding protein [bacterium]|nr:ATP-binding protein [bacterium]